MVDTLQAAGLSQSSLNTVGVIAALVMGVFNVVTMHVLYVEPHTAVSQRMLIAALVVLNTVVVGGTVLFSAYSPCVMWLTVVVSLLSLTLEYVTDALHWFLSREEMPPVQDDADTDTNPFADSDPHHD